MQPCALLGTAPGARLHQQLVHQACGGEHSDHDQHDVADAQPAFTGAVDITWARVGALAVRACGRAGATAAGATAAAVDDWRGIVVCAREGTRASLRVRVGVVTARAARRRRRLSGNAVQGNASAAHRHEASCAVAARSASVSSGFIARALAGSGDAGATRGATTLNGELANACRRRWARQRDQRAVGRATVAPRSQRCTAGLRNARLTSFADAVTANPGDGKAGDGGDTTAWCLHRCLQVTQHPVESGGTVVDRECNAQLCPVDGGKRAAEECPPPDIVIGGWGEIQRLHHDRVRRNGQQRRKQVRKPSRTQLRGLEAAIVQRQ
mmetsp:Transcript_127724/g.310555  ORF Transcript_127724/g.310555 Transcript_127724/m.310555 type:complete len:325 (-) Transcript_127724:704-1678(-)